MNVLTMIQQALAGQRIEGFPMTFPPPIATLVGFEMIRIERGLATFRMEAARDRHANPMGTLHGGILCDIADAAMGMSCASLLELGESFTTVELKINFFRPVVDAQIEARGHVVHGGKTLVYTECDIVTIPDERLIAKANSTCVILRGEQAKGR